MRHAIVAYPELDAADRAWIETIRAQHDPQARLLPAHFTLMFPAPVDLEIVKCEAAKAAGVGESFTVRLDRAVAHRDAPGSPSYVFLVPETGSDELRRLHDVLYGGVLSKWRDLRIPYLPHITVAAGLTDEQAGSLAGDLNRRPVQIDGVVEALTIVAIDDGGLSPVAPVAVVPLERIAS